MHTIRVSLVRMRTTDRAGGPDLSVLCGLSRPPSRLMRSVLIGLAAAVLLPAQITQVTGRVTDPADASVPKAKIEITTRAAGITRTAETSSDGSYSIELPGGTYTVAASAEGFKRLEKTNVRLDPGQKTTLDFKLDVGSVRDTVTVESASAGINVADATVSTTIGRQQFENAPLSSHSHSAMIEMTPGVVVAATNANDMWGQFSINGQRPNANYYTIDGVSANFSSTTSTGPYGSMNTSEMIFSTLITGSPMPWLSQSPRSVTTTSAARSAGRS